VLKGHHEVVGGLHRFIDIGRAEHVTPRGKTIIEQGPKSDGLVIAHRVSFLIDVGIALPPRGIACMRGMRSPEMWPNRARPLAACAIPG
jgi:hypothetical protein